MNETESEGETENHDDEDDGDNESKLEGEDKTMDMDDDVFKTCSKWARCAVLPNSGNKWRNYGTIDFSTGIGSLCSGHQNFGTFLTQFKIILIIEEEKYDINSKFLLSVMRLVYREREREREREGKKGIFTSNDQNPTLVLVFMVSCQSVSSHFSCYLYS